MDHRFGRVVSRMGSRAVVGAVAACAVAAITLAALPGCNIVGPAYILIAGPEKNKAVHTLDKERSTVIVVDDRASRLPSRGLRMVIAEEAQRRLLAEKAVKDMIDARAVQAVLAREKPGELMDIQTVGKSVGAAVVIYAVVDEAVLLSDGGTLSPSMTMRVKVIDVEANPARTWPPEREGHTLRVTPRVAASNAAPESAAAASAAWQGLASEAGRSLAELFYDHPANRRVGE